MKRFGIILSSMLIFVAPVFSDARGADSRVFPLTKAEASDAVSQWFSESGFAVSSTGRDGELEIRAVKGKEEWAVLLKPHSPLASNISASYSMNGKQRKDQVQNLWNFLTGYENGSHAKIEASSSGIPESILSCRESVVCISAKTADESYQFSGFVIDTSGLILCTAHNLKGVNRVEVTFFDGRTLQGRIVKIDYERDLSLIDVQTAFPKAVSAAGGPMKARMGQRLFSVGCPENLSGTIYEGSIDGPTRVVGRQTLWQVNMKVYPGSSGSPVFDEQGSLLAVVKGRRRGTDSTGFLIPHSTVIAFIKDREHEKK